MTLRLLGLDYCKCLFQLAAEKTQTCLRITVYYTVLTSSTPTVLRTEIQCYDQETSQTDTSLHWTSVYGSLFRHPERLNTNCRVGVLVRCTKLEDIRPLRLSEKFRISH